MQSLSDQGNLANLSAFLQNAVLFIVATTHVIELTRSAVTGNAGECFNAAVSRGHTQADDKQYFQRL